MPFGAVDDRMHYCPRPSINETIASWCCGQPDAQIPSVEEAEGNSASGRPQHRGAIVLTILHTTMKLLYDIK